MSDTAKEPNPDIIKGKMHGAVFSLRVAVCLSTMERSIGDSRQEKPRPEDCQKFTFNLRSITSHAVALGLVWAPEDRT